MDEPIKSPMTLQDVIGDYVYTETIVPAAFTTVQVAKPAPDRCYLGFAAGGMPGNVTVSTRPTVTAQDGFVLTSGSPNLVFDSRHSPGLVSAAWYMPGVGSGSMTVVEIFYRPRR